MGEAACHQGCQEVCPRHWGCQEAPPLQTWHSCSEGDQEVSEVHRVAHPQASLPASCSGDCSGLQDRPEVPELCCDGFAEASEAYLVGLFEDTNLCAIHAK